MEERLLAQKHTERVILRDISEAVALNRTEATYVASQVVTAKSAVLDLERKLVRYKEYAARTVSSFSATRNAKERMEIARRHTLALLALPQPRSPVSASPKARPCSQPATLDRERTEDEVHQSSRLSAVLLVNPEACEFCFPDWLPGLETDTATSEGQRGNSWVVRWRCYRSVSACQTILAQSLTMPLPAFGVGSVKWEKPLTNQNSSYRSCKHT